ncbi:hypothetical protein KC878_03575 [Candidatus Saccharibacteria bacterium]|nr:hypothetical protein [Candidatus Saccharibacteria bacterium]
MFTGISEGVCGFAWHTMVLPAIQPLADIGVINKHAGCIVVVDPNAPEFQVIFTATINGAEEDQKYMHIAMAKAAVSHRTGLSSSLVQTQYPYRYREGDTKWGGSTVDRGGLVVAFSGVQAVYDEMISEWMASAIRALCRNEMMRSGGVMENDNSFLIGDD